jgi:hypothetical protein
MSKPDLFGYRDPQRDLFAGETPQQRKIIDFPSEARARLLKVLSEARAAATLPWSERDARKWEILFPQMAEWLPDDEANQLCFEFAQELERLRNAA